ncbi:MAG: response regulator [Rhodospirillales bacterium]
MSSQGNLILVIEDEDELRDILATELGAAGYRVETAANGYDGYKRAVEIKPDLALCDIMMPKMNGFDFLRRVRADHRELDLMPVVFLTALGDESEKVAALALGVDDYVTKPFEFSLLIPQIDARLNQIRRISATRGDDAQHSDRGNERGAAGRRHGLAVEPGVTPVAAVCSRNREHMSEVATALTESGYEVFQTMSGEDLLTSLSEKAPEIVFLSYLTRDVAGFYVASRIKQITDGGLPVILIGDPELPITTQQLPDSYDGMISPISAASDIARIRKETLPFHA